MYKTHEKIGSATKLEAETAFTPEGGIGFVLDYGDDKYGLAFSHENLDDVFQKGISKMLGGRALGGFDYMLELGGGELPLFVGPRSIEVPPNPEGYHDVIMETNIVTMAISSHLEQRGIMLARRGGLSMGESWKFVSYDVQPPLRDRD
jgi:hypothetical protein